MRDHELLVILLLELRAIRNLLEVGPEYDFSMNENRSGAWYETCSGKVKSRPRQAHSFVYRLPSQSQFLRLQPWLSENEISRFRKGKDNEAIQFYASSTGVSSQEA